MYCPKCGTKLNEHGICPNCGTDTNNKNSNINNSDTGSVGWWFLGFFIPIAGLVLYFVFKSDNKPKNAHKVGWGALISAILSVVLMILVLLFTFFVLYKLDANSEASEACHSYCSDGTYNEKDNSCTCSNGMIIYLDANGNIKDYNNENIIEDNAESGESNLTESNDYNDVNLDNTSEEINNWYYDVTSKNQVVTVIGLSYCSHCINYKPVLEKLATDNNFKMYWFDIDKMNEDDANVLTYTYNLSGYTGASPYTFVINNNKLVKDNLGFENEEKTVTFLKEAKVIKD